MDTGIFRNMGDDIYRPGIAISFETLLAECLSTPLPEGLEVTRRYI